VEITGNCEGFGVKPKRKFLENGSRDIYWVDAIGIEELEPIN